MNAFADFIDLAKGTTNMLEIILKTMILKIQHKESLLDHSGLH
jgi:hypothetical protein